MGNTTSQSKLKLDFELINESEELEAIKWMDKAVQPQMMEELKRKLDECSVNIDRYLKKYSYRSELHHEEMLLTEEEKEKSNTLRKIISIYI